MLRSLTFCVLCVSPAIVSATQTMVGQPVSMAALAHHGKQYLGKHVTVDACIYSARPHGAFIAPCKYSSWRQIVSFLDPKDLYWAAVSNAYKGKSVACGITIRAQISGTVVMFKSQAWPNSVPRPTLKISSITNPKSVSCPSAPTPNKSFKPTREKPRAA